MQSNSGWQLLLQSMGYQKMEPKVAAVMAVIIVELIATIPQLTGSLIAEELEKRDRTQEWVLMDQFGWTKL